MLAGPPVAHPRACFQQLKLSAPSAATRAPLHARWHGCSTHATTLIAAVASSSGSSADNWIERPAFSAGAGSDGAAEAASTSTSTSSEPLHAHWPRHKLVTALILKAPDLREVEILYRQYGRHLNSANAVAMLTQLSRLYPAKQLDHTAAVQRRVLKLALALAQRLAAEPALDVEETIQTVSALARLGLRDRERFLPLLSRLLEALPRFHSPSHFAEAAWAVARLGHDPGQVWIAELLDASRSQVQAFKLAELANMIWALAKWGYRPGTLWMTLFFRRCLSVLGRHDVEFPAEEQQEQQQQQQQQQGRTGAEDDKVASLTSMAWALAVLNCPPPREVVACILIHSQALFPVMSSQGFANIAWALCRLDVRPPAAWVSQLVAHSRAALPGATAGMSYSNLVWALANWRAVPDAAWLSELVQCATPLLPRMQPEELSTLLQGLVDLEHKPPAPWVSAALEVFHKNFEPPPHLLQHQHQQRGSSGVDFLSTSGALSSSMALYTPASAGGANATSPTTIARLLWSISKLLQSRTEAPEPGGSASYSGPGPAWLKFYRPILEDLVDALAPGLPQLPAPMLVDVLVALADLQLHPGIAWLALHERCCNGTLSQLTGYQVNLLFNAVETIQNLETPPPRIPLSARASSPSLERGTGALGFVIAAQAARDRSAPSTGRVGAAGTRRPVWAGRHQLPAQGLQGREQAPLSAEAIQGAGQALGTRSISGDGANGSQSQPPVRGGYRSSKGSNLPAGYRTASKRGALSGQSRGHGTAVGQQDGVARKRRGAMLALPPPPTLPLTAEPTHGIQLASTP